MSKLTPSGKALIVVVNPLADFFRSRIRGELWRRNGNEVPAFYEERGKGHIVMMYGASDKQHAEGASARVTESGKFPEDYPAYRRCTNAYIMEDISYTLNTIHGVADFDTPRRGESGCGQTPEPLEP
jgi:hypothetical protein